MNIEGACDCHIHVYEEGYPLAASATFTPPPAPASAYRDVQRGLGFSRAIVVQPTGYGFDNRCTLAAIGQLGAGARGIAVMGEIMRAADPEAAVRRLLAAFDGK